MNAASPGDRVFLHPIALDSDSTRWLDIPGLVTPTLPGHGSRRRDHRGASLDDMADEIAGWTSGPIHLIGCSMGGMVAMHFALRYPGRVASLVLGYTTARIARAGMIERAEETERVGAAGMAGATMQRWFSEPALEATPPAPQVTYARSRLVETDTGVIADAWRAIAEHDVLDSLGDLEGIPTTCIAGRNDRSTPLTAMESTADAIPGARLVVTDHPHMGFLEDPSGFSELVLEHFDRLNARSMA